MKAVFSAKIFACAAHLSGKDNYHKYADMDNNGWPRTWAPEKPGLNRSEGMPAHLGDHRDGFGNMTTMLAVAANIVIIICLGPAGKAGVS